MAQALEVFAVHCGTGLDLDTGDLAEAVFKDEVNSYCFGYGRATGNGVAQTLKIYPDSVLVNDEPRNNSPTFHFDLDALAQAACRQGLAVGADAEAGALCNYPDLTARNERIGGTHA
jgi:hypothetical protein